MNEVTLGSTDTSAEWVEVAERQAARAWESWRLACLWKNAAREAERAARDAWQEAMAALDLADVELAAARAAAEAD